MNTSNAQLVKLSQQIYKEWYRNTVLVQSCSNEFEGELNLETRELDIPVFHDLSVHTTSLKERELKPAKIEFIRASTKRVSIDKGRYSHWGETTISKLVDKLSKATSETRKKLIKKWALEAEKELAVWVAKLPVKHQIDLITNITPADGILDKESLFEFLDILKAHAEDQDMSPEDFTLFVSSRFETVIRDSKILLGSNLSADDAFKKGYVGVADNVTVRKHEIKALTSRNATTKVVEAEWGIWKTRDGIQYVVPYKNTITYEISPDQILLGGNAYQSIEYYDFFNLYPARLKKVKIRYVADKTPPTSF
ncbi:MAG: hypothetical protein PF513_03145 [Tenericutes bacterium]|jgi:hypothetical protein|nr:hypothetical protein [Mycoplasmatota bacterium]